MEISVINSGRNWLINHLIGGEIGEVPSMSTTCNTVDTLFGGTREVFPTILLVLYKNSA